MDLYSIRMRNGAAPLRSIATAARGASERRARAGAVGFEPTNGGTKTRWLTTCRRPIGRRHRARHLGRVLAARSTGVKRASARPHPGRTPWLPAGHAHRTDTTPSHARLRSDRMRPVHGQSTDSPRCSVRSVRHSRVPPSSQAGTALWDHEPRPCTPRVSALRLSNDLLAAPCAEHPRRCCPPTRSARAVMLAPTSTGASVPFVAPTSRLLQRRAVIPTSGSSSPGSTSSRC